MGGRTVAIQFIRGAIAMASCGGPDVGGVLRRAGIPADLLDENAARVTETQAARTIQALWDVTGDELLGAGPKPVPRGTFRMVTLGLIHAVDLATALRRLIEFADIGMGFDTTLVTDDERTTRMLFDPDGRVGADQLVVVIGMVVGHRFASWLIGRRIDLTSVELVGSAPPYAQEYASIFGVAPTFGAARASITFDGRHLRAPVVRDEAELTAFIQNLPNDLLFRRDYDTSTSSRVRRMVERRASADALSVDDVARSLNVSAQHLRRLLRDEGTTFRHIKDEILRDDAISSLALGRETVEEMSGRLGFSEPSAFRRAFRRWTGGAPGAYLLTATQ